LFHRLIREAVSNWKRAEQRAELARLFDHGPMREVSDNIANAKPSKFPQQLVGIVTNLQQTEPPLECGFDAWRRIRSQRGPGTLASAES